MKQNRKQQSTVARLRSIIPPRPVQAWEARRFAEQQANCLRSLVGDPDPCLDLKKIELLPRVDVSRVRKLGPSGSTTWRHGSWRIQINGSEALVRQRFTLAHEFKHVLDAPALEISYANISNRFDGDQQIESICNHFAACLLMPKNWVKRLWRENVQDLDELAASFGVSTSAMSVRLQTLELIDRAQPYQQPTSNPQWHPNSRSMPKRKFDRRTHGDSNSPGDSS